MSAIAGIFVGLTLAGLLLAPAIPEHSEEPQQPAISVLTPPSPVLATDGRRHLVYEILVENTTPSALRLDRVEVVAPGQGVVAEYRGRQLEKLLVAFGPPRRTLAPGGLGGVFLDVRLSSRDRFPALLEHRLVFHSPSGQTVVRTDTDVDRRPPSRVSPPLRGEGLLVLGCCGRNFGHRFVLLEVDGNLHLAQRFANRVRRGQILGLVGNSGNSDFAHLHFHVTDGPSNLGANGVPYVFDRFRLDARVEGLESEPPSPSLVPAPHPRLRSNQLPLTGDVISFG